MRGRLRSVASGLFARTPSWVQFQLRTMFERRRFAQDHDVHALPDIFHYWSNTYLLPKHQLLGFDSPEQFFAQQAIGVCQQKASQHVRAVSLGAGNCDAESRLAMQLRNAGFQDFTIDCVDMNTAMLKRGAEHARRLDVSQHIRMVQGDFNKWQPNQVYDLVIANQSLHHVLELEFLFDSIHAALAEDGVFVTSDMIGRNGHQRWPEALAALQPFWSELPDAYRYNRLLRRQEEEFLDHDCSAVSFEGIRAQDVLPLLVERFDFQLFLPFANIVLAVVDRPFGHNFDAAAHWDRDFIDRLHARDEQGILRGELKPTQMLAAMGKQRSVPRLLDPRLTPELCIRHPS